jgi:hypothetical protein
MAHPARIEAIGLNCPTEFRRLSAAESWKGPCLTTQFRDTAHGFMWVVATIFIAGWTPHTAATCFEEKLASPSGT